MTTLAAVLIRQRSAPLETVEQAMLRQSLFGGDLATNLIELRSIGEAPLLVAIASALECPSVPPGPLPQVPVELREVVSGQWLSEQAVLPLAVQDGSLVVAIAGLPSEAVVAELSRRFSLPLSFRAGLEVRIREALSETFGWPLDARTRKALARLSGHDVESIAPSTMTGSERPPSSSSSGKVSGSNSMKAPSIPKLANGKHAKQRRLGPYTVAMVEADLMNAASPGEIIDTWLDFAAQYFEYTAIFAVQGDLVAGKQARGTGTVGEPFSRIGVPLDLPSILERASKAPSQLLSPLEKTGLDRSLASDLGREPGPLVLLLPIRIRGRVVLITFGDHGKDDVELERVGDVLAVRPLVERHLERLVMERKRGRSLLPSNERTVSAPPKPQNIPKREERAAHLAAALDESAQTTSVPTPRRVDSALPTRPSITSDLPTAPVTVAPLPPIAATSFTDAYNADLQGFAQNLPDEHDAWPDHFDASKLRTSHSLETGESWELISPVLSVGDSSSQEILRAATNPSDSQSPSFHSSDGAFRAPPTQPGIAPRLELVNDSEAPSARLDHAAEPRQDALPPFRAESHAARMPQRPSESQEMQLPTVLVDYESDCMELISRLTKGDHAAVEELVGLGDAAISILVREMPGPVTSPSRAPRGESVLKASECGPILRALAEFGPAARPYVVARTNDTDPKVRSWAVRLLGELGGRSAAVAVAQRIMLDRDTEVKRAAFQACQLLSRDAESEEALREAFVDAMFDQKAVITQRLAAVDALVDLRDIKSIPSLINLLSDTNPGAAAGAKQALVVLLRQDFGYDVSRYKAFWNENKSRDRIEWVIDSLDHRQPTIRQAAAEELRLLSRLYVGDYDDESAEARAKVQRKYRDWWAAGGKNVSLAPRH